MKVTRVNGKIEPACDSNWTLLQRLEWHLSICKMDNPGMLDDIEIYEVEVNASGKTTSLFNFRRPSGSTGPFEFTDAWTFINGLGWYNTFHGEQHVCGRASNPLWTCSCEERGWRAGTRLSLKSMSWRDRVRLLIKGHPWPSGFRNR